MTQIGFPVYTHVVGTYVILAAIAVQRVTPAATAVQKL